MKKLDRDTKRCTSDVSFLTTQRKVTARLQTCLTMWRLWHHFPPSFYCLNCHQQQEQKWTAVEGGSFLFCFFLVASSFSFEILTFTLVCFGFGIVSSAVCSRRKLRMRNIHFPSHSENPAALFLAVTPAEVLEISLLHPVLPLLLNEMAATAPPLGSISRPLCWQKEQQITFTWIVRFIIISRWQSLHYNAAEKRLTSFQIKIYNANTHLWLFVQA